MGAAGYDTANSIYAPLNTTSNNESFNLGLTERLKYVLDYDGETLEENYTSKLTNLITQTELGMLYVSHLSNKVDGATTKSPVLQYSVRATIYLKSPKCACGWCKCLNA